MRKGFQASALDRLLTRLRGGEPKPAAVRPPSRPFQATSIYRGTDSCKMVRKFSEHRFLVKDAPPLPLMGCTMSARCDCRYVKHADRRSEARRLVEFGVSPILFDGKERRVMRGRRARDSNS
ncbi:MAG: hypothetical protein ABW106_01310 [Steroidobacteraceae bacterium]